MAGLSRRLGPGAAIGLGLTVALALAVAPGRRPRPAGPSAVHGGPAAYPTATGGTAAAGGGPGSGGGGKGAPGGGRVDGAGAGLGAASNQPASGSGPQPPGAAAATPEPPGGPGPAPLTAAEAQLLRDLLAREAADALAAHAQGADAAPSTAPRPAWWTSVVSGAARVSGLPPALIAAVIQVESEGDPAAVSPAGAEGLMQLLPSTAAELGVTNIFDPAQNADGGARYLAAWLLRYSGGQQRCVTSPGDCPYALTIALAAYNAGPSAVARYGGVPPYPETERYVSLVGQLFREYQAEG